MATLNLPPTSFRGKTLPSLYALVGIATNPINFFIIFQMYESRVSWSADPRIRAWQQNVLRILSLVAVMTLTWLGGEKLQNFLALVGGFGCATLALILPTALHVAICKPTGRVKVFDCTIFLVGVVI